MSIVRVERGGGIAIVRLNDPQRRNALGNAMFDALHAELGAISADVSLSAILLAGEGPAFCAGFDLAACSENASLLGPFILRLSALLRKLRRAPQVVVAAVHGHALAGGCAILSACDFVFIAPEARVGYPVHRIGVSPVVSAPTLSQSIGFGPARALQISGELIDGHEAKRIGLATHVAASADSAVREAIAHCRALAAKPRAALRATKAWLNEVDGSLTDASFDGPAHASAILGHGEEARAMLAAWRGRSDRARGE
jgi:enoyl-CoA hydratase/carnithine racemase